MKNRFRKQFSVNPAEINTKYYKRETNNHIVAKYNIKNNTFSLHRLLGGSVDIDAATVELYPNDNRWDYAFDYNGETFFIEVHTASTSETSTVLRKLEWLKVWLSEQAPEIDKLKSKKLPPFYWVQSKKYALPTHTPQYRKAVSAELIPIKEWNYELLCKQYASQPKSKKRVPKYMRKSKKDN